MNKKFINTLAVGAAALVLAASPVLANQLHSDVVDRVGYATETVMPENGDTTLVPLLLLSSIVFLVAAASVSEDDAESN